MATRRTDIQIQVLGLADLQAVNSALNTHIRAIQRLTSAYTGLNAVTGALPTKLQSITNDFRSYNIQVDKSVNTTNNFKNSLTSANTSGTNFLGTLLRYRAVSAVFEGIEKSVGAVVETMIEMEKQTARVQRVSPAGSTPLLRAGIAEESARTGADVKDIGEAYYQLNTQIKNNAVSFAALQTAMNLVVGTEADARQTTRAMLQIYNQFGSQLDKNVGQAEQFRRIGELLAITWKGADAEMVDITNALKYLGPIAEAAKVPLEQVMGTISALTAEGHRGRMGGTEAGQFLAQIIKNYNPVTGEIENKGAHVKIALTAEGGIDLQKTIQNIVDTANRMPVAQARSFLLAISGTQNAFRFLGTSGAEFMRLLKDHIEESTKALHGQTSETEKLRQTMTTTAVEWKRAWEGTINAIVSMLDASGLRNFFKSVADELQRTVEIGRQARELDFHNNQRSLADLTTGPVRGQTQTTRDTVQRALDNLLNDPNRGTPSENFLRDPLDTATQGMTPAERAMIKRRYQIPGNPGHRLREDVMRSDLTSMAAQLSDLTWGLPPRGSIVPFGVHPGAPLPPSQGGFTDPKLDKAREEAEKKRQEALDKAAKAAQDRFEFQKLHHGADDAETMRLARLADQASINANPDLAARIRYGLEGAVVSNTKDALAERKERLGDTYEANKEKVQQQAEQSNLALDIALRDAEQRGGESANLLSPAIQSLVAAAQRGAEREAGFLDKDTGKPIDADKLARLRANLQGPVSEQRERFKRYIEAGGNFGFSIPGMPSAASIQNEFGENLGETTDSRLRAIQRGIRPGAITGDANLRQQDAAQQTIDVLQQAVDALKGIPAPTEANIAQLKQFQKELADAGGALVDLKDAAGARKFEETLKNLSDKYELNVKKLEDKFYPRAGETEAQARQRQQGLLGATAVLAEAQYQKILNFAIEAATEGVSGPRLKEVTDQLEAADLNRKRADTDILKARRGYAAEDVEKITGPLKSAVQGGLLAFFHGQGDVGTLAQGIGGAIIDSILSKQIERWTDPLIQQEAQHILYIQGNTAALQELTNTLQTGGGGGGGAGGGGNILFGGGGFDPSTSPIAAAVAAGVAVGFGDAAGPGGALSGGAAGGSVGKRFGGGGASGPTDLQKGLSAGLAAYSIGAQSAQQGVNLGNVIGAGLTGFALGGPVGAAVGVGIDLIGGLFHHSNKPTQTPQDINPAFYNAPAGFDLAAYNYSAFKTLPTLKNVGFDVKPLNVPIVNVYVDGARVAARQEVTRQTSSINVSLNNTDLDRYAPI